MNYFDNPNYAVAVVGAGRGIGRAAALELAAQGAAVACFDSDADTARKTAEDLRTGRAIAAQLDVARRETIAPAIDKAVATFGHIDALVNCAGITGRTR